MKAKMNKLPDWFKEKYKVELSNKKEAGRYWVEINDMLRVIEESKRE